MPSGAGERAIQLRVPRRYRFGFSLLTGLVVLGCIVAIVLDPSWVTIASSGAIVGLFAWIWGTMFAARRARGDMPNQLVLTKDGIRSPMFSLDWDRVARAWLGETSAQTGSLRALYIEPLRASDVRWVRSKMIGMNSWLTVRAGQPRLRLLQVNVDLPLELLLAEMEERAGRSLSGRRL